MFSKKKGLVGSRRALSAFARREKARRVFKKMGFATGGASLIASKRIVNRTLLDCFGRPALAKRLAEQTNNPMLAKAYGTIASLGKISEEDRGKIAKELSHYSLASEKKADQAIQRAAEIVVRRKLKNRDERYVQLFELLKKELIQVGLDEYTAFWLLGNKLTRMIEMHEAMEVRLGAKQPLKISFTLRGMGKRVAVMQTPTGWQVLGHEKPIEGKRDSEWNG